MPHALLLSPDDQAVSAITGVLEEMSVTCERPLDGPSAAKKLNSQTFDLVLVDCENLPAAKLIFDVCRRPRAGTNPVPIAIVDGRAGLPTAFRLGAELILTKPVAKDQARTTIRTAVSRLKKDEPTRPAHPFEEEPTEAVVPAPPEVRAHAAAVAGSTTAVKPAEVAPPAPPAPPAPILQSALDHSEPATANPQSVTDEIASPRVQPKGFRTIARDLTPPQAFVPPKPTPPPLAPAPQPSDDPVVADLESEIPTPVFTSYREPQKKKGRGPVLLLVLMLGGGGFYVAWMYQPGFREMVQPWVDRAIAALHVPGQSQNPTPRAASSPAAAPAGQASSANAIPASASTANTVNSTSAPATGTNTSTPAAGTATPAGTAPATDTAAAIEKNAAGSDASDAAAPPATDSTTDAKKDSTKKNVVAAIPSDTELPGEKSAVILSSQGAEKRLLHHVQPGYPAQARKERSEGTVVLKAVVNDDGKVAAVRLVEGNPTLAAAAIDAVKQWRYRPYLRNGKAMPFQTIVLVEFQRH